MHHFLHQDILETLYALYDISIYLLSLNIYVCIVLIQHALPIITIMTLWTLVPLDI